MKAASIYSAFIYLSLLLAGCVSNPRTLTVDSEDFRPRTTEPENLVLRTTGAAGQNFDGYVLIDGFKQELSGTSPAEFPLKGSILIGEFRKQDGFGTLSFSIENVPRTRSVGFGGLKRAGDTCRFGYHDGAIETHRN
jgi:hypothetical protein